MSASGARLLENSRILLANTREFRKLQLRSRVSWPARIGLALPAAFGLFVLWLVVRALLAGGIQNRIGVLLASAAGLAFLLGPLLAARWTRFGAQVTLTPERLVVRRHWSSGGKVLDLALEQVRRVDSTPSGVVIAGPFDEFECGTGLTPNERAVVVDFLRQAIDDHIRPNAAAPAAIRPPLEFPYGEGLLLLGVETIIFLGVAAVSAYMGLHNKRGAIYWGVRLSPMALTIIFWATAGVSLAFVATLFYRIYDRITHPRRLIVRADRLELYDDVRGVAREILFRDIEELAVVTLETKQIALAIKHTGGVFELERRRLARGPDFDQIRDAITSGFEERADVERH